MIILEVKIALHLSMSIEHTQFFVQKDLDHPEVIMCLLTQGFLQGFQRRNEIYQMMKTKMFSGAKAAR